VIGFPHDSRSLTQRRIARSVSLPRWPITCRSGVVAPVATQWRPSSVSGSFQIACGFEDHNEVDSLRHDPHLKLVCDRLPHEADLASQPTLSRLENDVDYKVCYRLAVALVRLDLDERRQDGIPERIVLDFDGTDDPAHGHQEGVAYHGYYAQYMVRHEVARWWSRLRQPEASWLMNWQATNPGGRCRSNEPTSPKANGKLRPLRLPAIRDRAMQAMVKNALEPAWEAQFATSSYSFRPCRSCHDAMQKIPGLARGSSTKRWVLDADIQSAFDTICQSHLVDAIGSVPGSELIKQWLTAGYLEDGVLHDTPAYVPQGGMISPLL
jgi:Transposase DDE domain group 1/Reverse transcriptase (RNA-dependent DNA polymerase)